MGPSDGAGTGLGHETLLIKKSVSILFRPLCILWLWIAFHNILSNFAEIQNYLNKVNKP